MRFFLCVLVCSFFLALVQFVVVQRAFPEETVSLPQAVGIALRDNPRIKAKTHALEAAGEDVSVSKGYFLPSLTFESRFLRTDNPVYAFMSKLNEQRFSMSDFAIDSLNEPSPVSDFQNSFKLEQVLFSKKLLSGLAMSRGERKAADLDFKRLKESVTRDVVAAYLGEVTASRYLDAASRALEDTKEHARLAESRYQSGLGLYSDVLRASAARSEAEKQVFAAQKSFDVAGRALALVMGRDESVAALPASARVELEPLDVYYSSALSRPDILAAETRQKETEDGIEFARSSYYPEVGVGGEYQWNDHRSPISGEGQSYIVNAFLRWSIFDGARREHQVKKAKARAAEAGEYLQGMKKEARFRVYESYEAVQEAQKSLQSAKSELDSAREGMRLVRIRYENALAPVVDLLDSEAMLEKARARLIEAENGVLDKFSKLCFESGRSDEFVQEVAEKSMDKEQ